MAAPYTQLSPSATPGRRYSFTAKAAPAGPHTGGPFTELSVTATPGRRHSFVAKSGAAGKGEGPFTTLHVYAGSGQRYTFVAKTAADAEETAPLPKGRAPTNGSTGGALFRQWKVIQEQELELDEQDLIDIISLVMMSGVIK